MWADPNVGITLGSLQLRTVPMEECSCEPSEPIFSVAEIEMQALKRAAGRTQCPPQEVIGGP